MLMTAHKLMLIKAFAWDNSAHAARGFWMDRALAF